MRNVLVTGASRGIGLATAHYLAARGYAVIGVSRRRPEAPFPGRFECADLADEAALGGLAATLADTPIDCLVNNAGHATMQRLGVIDSAAWQATADLNIRAALLLTQACLPALRRSGQGRIVNISSRSALGKEGRSLYAASKAALLGLTRTWALELAADRITVNAVAPGPIATEFFAAHNPPDDPRTRAIVDAIPVQRLGRPEEVAAAIGYFLSEEAAFVTGQVLYVCGGLTVGRAPM